MPKFTNKKKISEGFSFTTQTPIDDRLVFSTLAELVDLGTDKAYTYYEGMIVYCSETQLFYEWKESPTGALTTSFTYPALVNQGVDYTGRDFNFVELALSIPISSNVLVVNNNGNDTTAQKGDLTKPWEKLTEAAAAASSGDVILVLPGTYTITDADIAARGTALDATLFVDGVTWYFEAGAILINGASETNPYRPFHTETNGETCTVLGYMEYFGQDETINETYNGSFTPILILADDINFHFELQDIDTGRHGGGLGNVIGDNINITVKCKGTWTHRAGAGWYNGNEGDTNNMSAILDFNQIISIEDPDYGIDGYGTPIFYPTGTDSRISITVKDCYATETDGVASSQAKEGQFLSTQYLTRSQLTIKCDNYKNDYSVAVNDSILWLRTVDCDISIHFDSCIADKLYYGVISLYNQNSTAETQPSRIKITGSYVGLDKPCITDLGHFGSAAIRNDDQVKVHAHLRSENSEVIRMDRAAADFELSGEVRCDWDNVAGHGIVLDAVGANLRLRDVEFVCANASAYCITSTVGPISLEAYNTFSHTNDNHSDITLVAPTGFVFPDSVINTIYTADDSLTGNRTVDLASNVLNFNTGQITIQGAGTTNTTTSLLVENSSGTELFKILDDGTITGDFPNFATTDLSLDANRTHDLNGNNLTLITNVASGDEFIIKSDVAAGRIRMRSDNSYSHIYGYDNVGLKVGSSGFSHVLFTNSSGNQISSFSSGVTIIPTSSAGRSALLLRAGTGFTGTSKVLDVQGTGGALGLVVDADRNMYLSGGSFGLGYSDSSAPAKLTVKGSGSTSATTALLVENNSGTELFKILDDGTISGTFPNFATADLTLTGDRTHDLDGNVLKFDNGQVTIEGSGATNATTSILIQNSLATQLLKIDDSGGFALGSGAIYGNENCVAIGTNADAEDNSSPLIAKLISIGTDSSSNGSGSISLGVESSSNAQSTSVGFSSSSSFSSTAIGYNANASNTGTAVGHSANSSNTRAIAIGNSATSSRFGSIAIGYTANVSAPGSYGMALGAGSNVSASNAILISAKGTTQTNSTANSFEVNLDSTTSVFRFGNTVDGWLNTTGSFGFGTITPSASSVIELDSTTKGFLPPRMTTTEKNNIVAPATGLVLYDTDLDKLCVYTGLAWETITSS